MLTVALTGNIASGKSTVADVWRELGATVIDSDELARSAVAAGSPALERIAARWGPGILLENGELDRAALRAVVFADPAQRSELESIIHPEVMRSREQRLREAEDRGETLVVSDIPLLFELELQSEFDVVVVVDAAEATRLDRLVRLRGIAEDQARSMIASQDPSGPKLEQADIVIHNDGTLADLRNRAREVYLTLQQNGQHRGAEH